jgi:hypothetical protein
LQAVSGARAALYSASTRPNVYNRGNRKEITDEDKIIEAYKIVAKPVDVVIVPVENVFQ